MRRRYIDRLRDQWFSAGLVVRSVPAGYVKVGSVSRLEELEDPLDTSSRLVRSSRAARAAGELGSGGEEERAMKALLYIATSMFYDHVHASASIHWRTMAYTYMVADEALRLGRGICGEMSLALISVLRHMGVPAVLVRPSVSHLAVLARVGGRHLLLDPSFLMVTVVEPPFPRYARSPGSRYVLGPVRLVEFEHTTIRRRRLLAKRALRRRLSAEEALDLEYLRHCLDPPYGTELAQRYSRLLREHGYCRRRLTEAEALLFAHLIAECGRPEARPDPDCYRRAWLAFEEALARARLYKGRWRRWTAGGGSASR